MHDIPAYTLGVTLYLRDGRIYKYGSYQSALKALGYQWICDFVRTNFRTFVGQAVLLTDAGILRVPQYAYADAIMRNDFGQAVTAEDFRPLRSKRVRRYSRFASWNGTGPVPGTGAGRRGSFFRSIHTAGARKQAQLLDPVEPRPRASRSENNIPDNWDDLRNSAYTNRNWKRFRRTRWKATR